MALWQYENCVWSGTLDVKCDFEMKFYFSLMAFILVIKIGKFLISQYCCRVDIAHAHGGGPRDGVSPVM